MHRPTPAPLRRLHIQVFQVQARLGQEGGKVGEEQRKTHHHAAHFRHHRLHHRLAAKQVRVQGLRRDAQQVGEVFELGQFGDQADDGRHVAGLGRAQVVRRV